MGLDACVGEVSVERKGRGERGDASCSATYVVPLCCCERDC